MIDTNYFSGVVKIIENPKSSTMNKTILVTKFRAQLPQVRNKVLIHLVFWDKLGRDVENYYKIDDYIIIEGYLSVREKKGNQLMSKSLKKIEITVLKIYPFLLTYNRKVKKE
jgi:single-stranded DNA-binding protein